MDEANSNPVQVECVDLGWRSPDGDFGWLGAPPGSIGSEEISELFHWADSTRSSFGQHWFWVPLGVDYRALIRVSPLSGGRRGTASTVQILLMRERVVTELANLGCLLSAFPDVPSSIGQPAIWKDTWRFGAEAQHSVRPTIPLGFALQRLMSPGTPESPCLELPIAERLPPEEQIQFALHAYSLIPSNYRGSYRHAFSTENAPSVNRARYVVTYQPSWHTGNELDLDTELLLKLGQMSKGPGPFRLPDIVADEVGFVDRRRWRKASSATVAASLLSDTENSGETFFSLSKALFSESGKVRTDWAAIVEAELLEIAPERAYGVLRQLIEDSDLSMACGFAPAWAPRMLVSNSVIFSLQDDSGFSKHLSSMAKWFPSQLATRLRENRSIGHKALMDVIRTCREWLSATVSAAEGTHGLESPPIAASVEASRAELFDFVFETALGTEMKSPDAKILGVALMLDCAERSPLMPTAALAAARAHARTVANSQALNLTMAALADADGNRLSAFLRAFKPTTPHERQRHVRAFLAAGVEAARSLPRQRMQTLAHQDGFLGFIDIASRRRTGSDRSISFQN